MEASRLRLTLGVIPAVLMGLLILPFVLFWGDLPNPMATHWGMDGSPNGSLPPAALLLIMAGIAAAVWWGVVKAVRRTPYEAPSFVAGLYAIVTLLGVITWRSVSANRGQSSWQMADDVGLLQILLTLIPAAIIGYAGWMLGGGRSIERTPAAGVVPRLAVGQPDATIWSSRGNGRTLYVIGLVVLVVAVAIWSWATFVVLLLAVLVLLFAEVRVTVSQKGATVSLGWLGIPSWTVPMSAISQAEVETVDPMAYGGWGYRLRPGVRAIVTRGGESLRLVRGGQPDLVLTVDDAHVGAGLINSMLGVTSQTDQAEGE